jgi:3-oxoacyl-[acyl-carrier protein] reductase
MTAAWDQQVAVVTGASSGLGAQFARVLAAKGVRVALVARRIDRLTSLKAEIDAAGGKAMSLALDVTKVESFDDALSAVEAELGPVTLLINNAGQNVMARATDIQPSQFDDVLNLNLRSPFFLATACARRWIANGIMGRIVNISSGSAYRTVPAITPYAVSKAALNHLTACLAREWARYEIAVNGLAPGYVRTEINEWLWDTPNGQKLLDAFPRRRVGEPADLDAALLLLADPTQRFITGQTLVVDDGQVLA